MLIPGGDGTIGLKTRHLFILPHCGVTSDHLFARWIKALDHTFLRGGFALRVWTWPARGSAAPGRFADRCGNGCKGFPLAWMCVNLAFPASGLRGE